MPLVTAFQFQGMHNTCDPASAGPPDDSVRIQERAYTQCVELRNVDVDTDFNISRRAGSTLVAAGSVSAGWSDNTAAYIVADGLICQFDGTQYTPIDNSPTLSGTTEFCAVNDVVAFSDNTTIGVLDQGVPYVFDAAPDLSDLEAWVKAHYPAGADAQASNLEIDAFKLATFAGRCLEFFNGALYFARDNFVFCTKTFGIDKMDIRYNVVAGFKDPVTMIKAVNDGLFIGTETEVCFLSGHSVYQSGDTAIGLTHGFLQRRVLPFGVVYGSATRLHAGKVTPAKAANLAPIWMTSDGVYVGSDGGQVDDLTKNQIYMPGTGPACGMARFLGAAWQYIGCRVDGSGTVVVNLDDATHSVYDNYQFTSFFKLNNEWYGTSAAYGVLKLEGDLDYAGTSAAAEIPFSALTPVVDFGKKEQKRCADLYLHARTSGQLVVDLYVDEALVAEELPFVGPAQLVEGVRRLRAKLPRGIKGTNWQFRVRNLDGCDATALSMKAEPVVLSRSV